MPSLEKPGYATVNPTCEQNSLVVMTGTLNSFEIFFQSGLHGLHLGIVSPPVQYSNFRPVLLTLN